MNLKIGAAVGIAFIITFGALYLAINFSNESEERKNKHKEILSQINLNENKILFLGSSHIGHLNMTHIINNISDNNPEFTIYNLAENGNSPKLRYNDLNKIIELNPKIVFYGISYRDFNQSIKSINSQNEILDIKTHIEDATPEEIKDINPQFLTRKAIRTILDESGIFQKPTYDINPPNTPFFSLSNIQTEVIEESELKRQLLIISPTPSKIKIDKENNFELEKFGYIIERLQNEDIEIVVFTTPLSRTYLDEIPESVKKSFRDILDDLAKQNGIKIYEFEERYADKHIWNNLDHIAYNNKAIIFSDEVIEMILQEVNP
ncbi:hypothetical protein OAJ71_01965 [Nitrosopumilus sp.]|nr:hypothetical protein [Nitrosopumilus sp.]